MITTNIYRISDIETAAKAATLTHSNAEQASPYPIHSTAFTVFKKAFDAERERQLQLITE